MDNLVLVINKNPQVIDEFLDAYRDENFQIDVARNGVEGFRMLQSKDYKVVITGMVMPDINGEKLLAYLHKEKPEVVCIVYTTRLNPGQLLFLVNKMHVFRMFLRPGDYRGEMLTAITEAIEKYDLDQKMIQVEEETRKEIEEKKKSYVTLKTQTVEQDDAEKIVMQLGHDIFRSIINEYSNLDKGEKEELLDIEEKLIKRYIEENRMPAANLMAMEVKLRHHFCEGFPERSLGVNLPSNVIQLSDALIQNVYMTIYILTSCVSRYLEEYDAHINVRFEGGTQMTVSMDFQFNGPALDEQPVSKLEKAVIQLHERSVELMSNGVRRRDGMGFISYKLDFDTKMDFTFV